MKHILWLLKWLLKAAIFFTLFAFALNNQQDVTVNFFFGNQWQAALVLVVLAAFALGVGVGALGMLPWWWRQRQRDVSQHPAPESSRVDPPTSVHTPGAPATAPSYADGI